MTKYLAFLSLIIVVLASCAVSIPTINAENIENFDKLAKNHILFLTFDIKKNKGQIPETVSLLSSVAGSGKMKNLKTGTDNPFQIKSIQYFSNAKPSIETYFEHPLYKSLEIFSPDGTITRKSTTSTASALSMKIQYENNLEKIELYSIKPDFRPVKIYTLKFKP